MTITLYSGTPGSGKSLHQAQDIWYCLRFGKPFVTNFEVNYKACKRRKQPKHLLLDNEDLTPRALIEFADDYWRTSGERFREGRIKLFIDECQILFNARTWDMKSRAEWVKFFTMHRKYGYDIVLVAQFDRMIDRQIRSLIEYEIVHRKLSNFGLKGKLLSLAMGNMAFVAVKTWYPLKERVGAEWMRPNKTYFNLYDSYKRFSEETPS